MGIPLRGHRDDGCLNAAETIHDVQCSEGNFRSMLQLYSIGNSALREHLTNAAKNSTWLSPITQNEIIEMIGNCIQKKVVEEVQKSGVFSVLADETTDSSHRSQLSVSVRFVAEKNVSSIPGASAKKTVSVIQERFLEFLNPESLTVEGLALEIVNVLRRLGLDVSLLVGQGYDGASAMSGQFNGVQKYVRDMCASPAVYVHCVAHVLNLTLVHASKVPAIRNTLSTIARVADFFNSSSVSCKKLTDAMERFEDTKKEKIKIPCATRWVEKQEAVHTFFIVYSVIVEQLQLETMAGRSSRRSTDAQALLDSITRGQFVVGLAILNSVMTVTKRLSKVLQSSTNDLMTALTMVKTVVDQLRQWRVSDDRFRCIFEEAQNLCEHEIEKPRANANLRHLNQDNPDVQTAEEYYRITAFNSFLDSLLQQMDDRYQTPTRTAMMLCNFLPKYAMHSEFETIKKGVELFLNLLPGTLFEVAIEFEAWKLTCSRLDDPPTDAAKSIDVCNPYCFPNIRKLLMIFASLPVSTASAERSFSVLKHLKSSLRSQMSEKRLTGASLAYIYSNLFNAKEISDSVLTEFLQKARRTSCCNV